MFKVYKNMKLIIGMVFLLLAITPVAFRAYIRDEIYQGNAQQLQTTYEQTNQIFTLFTQRNWGILAGWDANLQYIAAEDNEDDIWRKFGTRKNIWQYSDFYVFNENNDFITAGGRKGTADSIDGIFRHMYEEGKPTIATYVASSGQRKVVFAMPLKKPFVMNNITYTGVAVSYDTYVLENMLSRDVNGPQNSCYIVNAQGDTVMSMKSRFRTEKNPGNIFEFLEQNTHFTQNTREGLVKAIKDARSSDGEFETQTSSYYIVTQPMGINDWSLVAILQADMVNSRSEKLIAITVFVIAILAFCLMALMVLACRSLLSQERSHHEELDSLANTDDLTGLLNERKFSMVLHSKEANKESFVLYYLDLDRFKPVNDTYGHDMGDKLLKEVAGRLQQCIRESDYAFRIGGDEFAIIISAAMDEERCREIKNRIVATLLDTYKIDGKRIHVGASCGYAVYPRDNNDTAQIRILADQRMYAEKEKHHQRDGKPSDNR